MIVVGKRNDFHAKMMGDEVHKFLHRNQSLSLSLSLSFFHRLSQQPHHRLLLSLLLKHEGKGQAAFYDKDAIDAVEER